MLNTYIQAQQAAVTSKELKKKDNFKWLTRADKNHVQIKVIKIKKTYRGGNLRRPLWSVCVLATDEGWCFILIKREVKLSSCRISSLPKSAVPSILFVVLIKNMLSFYYISLEILSLPVTFLNITVIKTLSLLLILLNKTLIFHFFIVWDFS